MGRVDIRASSRMFHIKSMTCELDRLSFNHLFGPYIFTIVNSVVMIYCGLSELHRRIATRRERLSLKI